MDTIARMAADGASVAQMAAKLLHDGLGDFIGKGVVIEQARHTGDKGPVPKGRYRRQYWLNFVRPDYGWREVYIVRPIDHTTKPVNVNPIDSAIPDIRENSQAGSFERLNQLAAFYADYWANDSGVSPFLISDDAIAKRVAAALSEKISKPIGMNDSEHDSKHLRASTICD